MLVARENLGVLLAEELAARLAGPQGIRLDALAGLDWVGFPRSDSPAWYDELAAILRTHGIDAGAADSGDHFPIPSVMFTAVASGHAFALAPPLWAHPIPHTVVWTPLADDPVVRRSSRVCPASGTSSPSCADPPTSPTSGSIAAQANAACSAAADTES
jgi:LysR substrate binding domain